MSTSQRWPRKSPSGLIMVAPDHRRPAFGRDGLEFLLAHPQVADPATWMSWVRLMESQRLGGTQSTFVGVAVSDEKARLVVGAYAGNSRAYAVGANGVRLLTAESSPSRLGSGRVKPCPIMMALGPYDILLLMSDGAWTPIGGTYKLQKAVAKAAMHHFSEVPQAILDEAARGGRYDDMTAVALRIR